MTGKPSDRQRIEHMLEAIERIETFTNEMTYEEFEKNEMAQFAVIKNFEIIGEAAYQISDELRSNYEAVEWRKIAGFRHVLVHDYYKVNVLIIWNAKEERIEELKDQLEDILNDFEE